MILKPKAKVVLTSEKAMVLLKNLKITFLLKAAPIQEEKFALKVVARTK